MANTTTSASLNLRLLEFLKEPDSYPHSPDEVNHIQTHISHVFMAGSLVYKIKKPVNFEFLDYSTLENRKYYCKRELELNRRLCEDVYLEVVPIYNDEGEYTFRETKEAEVAEYAVKMKRLPEEYFLHSYIEDDSLQAQHLDRVVDKLTRFYRTQEPDEEVLKFGKIKKIKVNTDENFRQTEPFIDHTISENTYHAIKHFTNEYYRLNDELFRRRIEDKRIVDGHGDLHLEHIHITPEKVRIYDCIEFNDRFRYGDLASDLAFLAMDLDFNSCWKEERYLIEQIAEKLGDTDLNKIIDFYKCYRAYVKGKVKSLQSEEEEVDPENRSKSAEKAKKYFNLSLRYALLGSSPLVLIFMGRVGTGKSTLAEHIGEKLGMDIFSSDRIRKTLAGRPLHERTPAGERQSLYSPEMSDKTYGELADNALNNIRDEKSSILDATYSTGRRRSDLVKGVETEEADYLFIEARSTDSTIRNRLKSRKEKDNVVSDARAEDFDMLNRQYTSPDELSEKHLVQVDTNQTLEDTIHELYVKLIERHLKQG